MAICNACNNNVPDSSKICPFCGRNASHKFAARNWKCGKCGSMNGPEMQSCWKCGN